MKRTLLWPVFFLVLFIGAKALEYHPLSHSDDGPTDRCELCDYALLMESTPFSAPEPTIVEVPFIFPIEAEITLSFSYTLVSQEIEAGQFYRPPPAVPAI